MQGMPCHHVVGANSLLVDRKKWRSVLSLGYTRMYLWVRWWGEGLCCKEDYMGLAQ